jgi:magnesium transporter
MLLLVPDGADSILVKLEKSIRGDSNAKVDEVFGDGDGTEASSASEHEPELEQERFVAGMVPHSRRSSLAATASFLKSKVAGGGRLDGVSEEEELELAEKGGQGGGDEEEEEAEEEEAEEEESSEDSDEDNFDLAGEDDLEEAPPPFELVCLDSVLQAACGILQGDFDTLEKKVLDAMESLRGHHNSNGKLNRKSHQGINQCQEQLRLLKNEIAVLETRVEGFVRALDGVLDEDEDLALINLSRLITTPHRFVQPCSQQILEEEGDVRAAG